MTGIYTSSVYKSEDGELAVRERYGRFLRYWPAANQQLRVPTREGETFVVVCGPENARPLVLLHGSGGNAAMWMGDVALWAQHFRVYAVDMIGEPGMSAASRPPLASDAYALWLDDVMRELSLDRVSIVGVSLGGWLAIDYATRRPERVQQLILLCPGGVGRQLFGEDLVFPRPTPAASPAAQKFFEFVALIFENFNPRMEILPVFTDGALKRLTMPVMAILGAKDVLLDSEETKLRLAHNVANAEIRYLPEAGHVILGQAAPILEFLNTSPAD